MLHKELYRDVPAIRSDKELVQKIFLNIFYIQRVKQLLIDLDLILHAEFAHQFFCQLSLLLVTDFLSDIGLNRFEIGLLRAFLFLQAEEDKSLIPFEGLRHLSDSQSGQDVRPSIRDLVGP